MPAKTFMLLPVEEHEHAVRCAPCGGRGVTGERYLVPIGDSRLVIEVICGTCGGCGNGDPGHAGCKPDWHAYPEEDGTYPEHDDVGDDDGWPDCGSCGSGRGWYPVQGFAEGDGGEPEVMITRTLCGCSEDRLVEVPDVLL